MALVKFLLAPMAVLVAALAAAPACAQHGRRGMPPDEAERGLMMQQRQHERQGMQPMPVEHGRMSVEERRQLRRDIHEAGRELYRPHGRRFRADERDRADSR